MLAWFVGLRYTRAKRRNHFISFISLSSMLGIALGVMVLITVLSVMNGFDYEIHERLFALANQVTISANPLPNNPHLAEKLRANLPEIIGTAPFVASQGMLNNNGAIRAVVISGIDPNQEQRISALNEKVVVGKLDDLKPHQFNMIIGKQLAENLGLNIGDKVVLLVPQWTVGIAGVIPVYKRFTISGIFHAGNGFGFDTQLVFVHIKDAQALLHIGNNLSGLRLKISNLYHAPALAKQLRHDLGEKYQVTDWTEQFGNLFSAISMEKTMMFLILLLIIAVAAFNLVASLVMVVTDKESDIAILRTLGAPPQLIMKIFMVQGLIIGCVGTFIGTLSGIILSLNVRRLFDAIQSIFHIQLLSSNVYYVNYLPSRLLWPDVWHVVVIALCMSLIATLYPAWRASQVQPAEALRYE